MNSIDSRQSVSIDSHIFWVTESPGVTTHKWPEHSCMEDFFLQSICHFCSPQPLWPFLAWNACVSPIPGTQFQTDYITKIKVHVPSKVHMLWKLWKPTHLLAIFNVDHFFPNFAPAATFHIYLSQTWCLRSALEMSGLCAVAFGWTLWVCLLAGKHIFIWRSWQ